MNILINRLAIAAGMIAAALIWPTTAAGADDTFNILGRVRDSENAKITDATYRLLQLPDSSLVDEGEAFTTHYYYRQGGTWEERYSNEFRINNMPKSATYLLQLDCGGYETLFVEVDPAKIPSRSYDLDLGTLRLSKAKALREVTVTATKVKFYNKGDTIVYNADAFVLAEGSMLDALIAQLPGAEIKDNGQIYVNGRFVESLLLNGKDFFKGNNQVMLENLGAYTVKNIEVYDGQDEMDRIMGQDYGKRIYTMNVKLKKEYIQGLIVNAEGGYGIKDKFLGRLFAMFYNNANRFTVYGNANNISQPWKPDQQSTSSIPSPGSNNMRAYLGGVDYSVQVPNTPLSVEGSADARYLREVNSTSEYTTNFLSGGDTYGYSFRNNLTKSLSVNTSHALKIEDDTWNMQVSPKLSYNHNKSLMDLIAGTFTREWDEADSRFLEGIYSNSSADVLASVINRNRQNREDFGHSLMGNIWSNGKFKRGSDAFTYLVAYTYNRSHSDYTQDYLINYGDNPAAADALQRMGHTHPNYNWRAKGSAGYIWNFAKGAFVDMYYTYQRYESRTESRIYDNANYLESLGDNLAALTPSAMAASWMPDYGNSYDSRYREETHDLNFNVSWNLQPLKTVLYLDFPIRMRRQWLHYLRGDVDARLGRDKFFVDNVNLSLNVSAIPNHWIYVGFGRTVSSPDMVDMVDFTDTLDPLNIRRGNPDLRDATSHSFRIYDTWTPSDRFSGGLGYNISVNSNSLAYGYTYDRLTGVKTGSMYNVNGNMSTNGFIKAEGYFGPGNMLMADSRSQFGYFRSADLIATEGDPEKNIVNRYNFNENIRVGFQKNGRKVIGLFNATWSRYTSHQTGFTPFNALNLSYGVEGNVPLPANFAVNTSFIVYSRRGYSDPVLNGNNFVWNMRLSYSAMKGNLLLMLDGFDILHNLKSVGYTVNAQARTETWTNTLSRYVMLHVQWKFNKLPRSKKK